MPHHGPRWSEEDLDAALSEAFAEAAESGDQAEMERLAPWYRQDWITERRRAPRAT